MAEIPKPVAELLDAALVGELTVVDGAGRPVTYPLIPLWDGERVFMTSSTLFSRKLEHINGNAKVSVSITDPVAVGGRRDRALIQGDARVIDSDPHGEWERLLPIWEVKEPSIVVVPQGPGRAAALLRAGIDRGHAATRPVLVGRGRRDRAAGDARRHRGGRVMRSTDGLDARTGLDKLATFPYQIATWVGDDGYPVSVAVDARISPTELVARFAGPAALAVPTDRDVSLTGSHIRPQPGYGYDERRHVTVWGRATTLDGGVALTADRAWGWDESEVPFFEYSERSRRTVAQVLRRALRRARDAGPPEALARVPDAARHAAAVPHRDDRAGRPGHPDRRDARLVRPRRGAADDHRRVVRPARAQRRQRRLRHRVRAPTTRTSRRPSSAAARGSSSTGS